LAISPLKLLSLYRSCQKYVYVTIQIAQCNKTEAEKIHLKIPIVTVEICSGLEVTSGFGRKKAYRHFFL